MIGVENHSSGSVLNCATAEATTLGQHLPLHRSFLLSLPLLFVRLRGKRVVVGYEVTHTDKQGPTRDIIQNCPHICNPPMKQHSAVEERRAHNPQGTWMQPAFESSSC